MIADKAKDNKFDIRVTIEKGFDIMKVPDNIAGEKHRLKYPKGFVSCLSHDLF